MLKFNDHFQAYEHQGVSRQVVLRSDSVEIMCVNRPQSSVVRGNHISRPRCEAFSTERMSFYHSLSSPSSPSTFMWFPFICRVKSPFIPFVLLLPGDSNWGGSAMAARLPLCHKWKLHFSKTAQ